MLCLADHTGTTDTNYNAKSWQYQIIAGGGTAGATIGIYMVDAYLLCTAVVAMDEWRPNDFAANLPVLKLASFATFQKLSQNSLKFGLTSEDDKGVLVLTLFYTFMPSTEVLSQQSIVLATGAAPWCG